MLLPWFRQLLTYILKPPALRMVQQGFSSLRDITFEKANTLLWSTFVLYVPATSTECGLRRTDQPLLCFSNVLMFPSQIAIIFDKQKVLPCFDELFYLHHWTSTEGGPRRTEGPLQCVVVRLRRRGTSRTFIQPIILNLCPHLIELRPQTWQYIVYIFCQKPSKHFTSFLA